MSERQKHDTSTPGAISPLELYTVEEARRRLRLGEWSWRKMRRDGLYVLRSGGRSFVSGKAIIAYLEAKGGEQ
jgi:hypothetical protein